MFAKQCGDGLLIGNERCDDGNSHVRRRLPPRHATSEPGYACSTQAANPQLGLPRWTVCGDGVKERASSNVTTATASPMTAARRHVRSEAKCQRQDLHRGVRRRPQVPNRKPATTATTRRATAARPTCTIEANFSCTSRWTRRRPAQLVIPILYREYYYSGTFAGARRGAPRAPRLPARNSYILRARVIVKATLGNRRRACLPPHATDELADFAGGLLLVVSRQIDRSVPRLRRGGDDQSLRQGRVSGQLGQSDHAHGPSAGDGHQCLPVQQHCVLPPGWPRMDDPLFGDDLVVQLGELVGHAELDRRARAGLQPFGEPLSTPPPSHTLDRDRRRRDPRDAWFRGLPGSDRHRRLAARMQ